MCLFIVHLLRIGLLRAVASYDRRPHLGAGVDGHDPHIHDSSLQKVEKLFIKAAAVNTTFQ